MRVLRGSSGPNRLRRGQLCKTVLQPEILYEQIRLTNRPIYNNVFGLGFGTFGALGFSWSLLEPLGASWGLLGPLGASWSGNSRPPLGPSPGRPGHLEMPPRPPRQASQAPRAPRQASQAPRPSGAEIPDHRLDRLQDAQDIRNAAQAAQAGFPGPQAAQTGPQAALIGFSGRPSCWNGLRECSCRHCSCRQNTALWPCQTGPRPSRQAPRPPRHLALVARTTSRRAVASTWLLST